MKLPTDYNNLCSVQRRQVRTQYMVMQNNRCYHCGTLLAGPPAPDIEDKKVRKELFPPGFFNNPIHLHHSHDTGLTIGAVHAHCNAVLWEYHGE